MHSFGHDGRSSTRILVSPSGRLAEGYRYSAYGELRTIYDHRGAIALPPSANTIPMETFAGTNLLYNGEYYQASAEQYYLRARWYNPTVGRFDHLDPFSGDLQDPFSLHKYGFTHGNPLLFNDPTGMFVSLVD